MVESNLRLDDLPYTRRYLYEYERECMEHIKNNTFEENPFVKYFIHWDCYMEILTKYPNEKDLYDATNLPIIAKYYNNHTYTNNHYNESTGKKEIDTYSSSSSSSSSYTSSGSDSNFSISDYIADYAPYAFIILIIYLLYKFFSNAGAEELKKYVEENIKNDDRIIWEDPNFTPYNIENEVINGEDFPVKVKKLIK